jgi:hypothetical protein
MGCRRGIHMWFGKWEKLVLEIGGDCGYVVFMTIVWFSRTLCVCGY